MKNITTFLFVLISVAVTIYVLLCLGCGPTTDSARIYNDLGLAKVEMGQYEDAIADFDTAVESKPDFAEAYYNRGNAKVKLAEYKIAKADYNDAVQLKTTSEILKLYLAAITDFDNAIHLKPDHAYAYYSRGLAKVDIGQYKDAITDFESALKLAEQIGDTQLKRIVMTHLNSLKTPQSDKILRVGDKLPSFGLDDVYANSISWYEGGITIIIHGIKKAEGPHIHFEKKGSWVQLKKSGTRYICKTPKGCKVDLTNFIVTEGEIEVYYNKNSK